MCRKLDVKELVGVLKWPFCVGGAHELVFSEFEKQIREKTGRTFDGDIRKLIEQVNSLGINGLDRKFLDEPARRPNAQVTLKGVRSDPS